MKKEKAKGLLAVIFISLFIILCFGFLRNNGDPAAPKMHTPPAETDAPKAVSGTAYASPSSYTLRLEEEKLNLYLNSDGEIIFMEEFELNEGLYPAADIAELKKGITITGIERCVSIIEDFTS